MLSKEFIKDLFDRQICHTKSYTKPDLLLLKYINYYGLDIVMGRDVKYPKFIDTSSIIHNMNSYDQISKFVSSFGMDLYSVLNNFNLKPPLLYDNFLGKNMVDSIQLAPPLINGNKSHRIFKIDGEYFMGAKKLIYDEHLNSYGFEHETVNFIFGQTYVFEHLHMIPTIETLTPDNISDFKISILFSTCIYNVTNINFDFDKFKKLLSSNPTVAHIIYKNHLAYVK